MAWFIENWMLIVLVVVAAYILVSLIFSGDKRPKTTKSMKTSSSKDDGVIHLLMPLVARAMKRTSNSARRFSYWFTKNQHRLGRKLCRRAVRYNRTLLSRR